MAKRLVLPPIPDAVATQLGPVPVNVVKKLHYRKDGKKQEMFGRFRAMSRTIEINEDIAPVMRWQTFFHEWMHVVMTDAGLHNVFTPEQQETICDAVATARVAELLAHLK